MVDATTPQEKLAVQFYETLGTGELEKVRALLHPDATWTVQVTGVPGVGVHGPRDYIVDTFLAPVRGLFVPGDPKVLIDTVASKGDFVMLETHGEGTLSDGRIYRNKYAWAVDIRDGLVFAIREYMDSYYVHTLFPDAE